MKTLFNITALLIPLLVFSQAATLPPEIKEVQTEIITKRKEIDSVKTLKAKEIKKQLKIIALIKHELAKIKFQKSAAPSRERPVPATYDTAVATKPENEPVYWEEVRRKWTGRLFNRTPKIRIFKFDEKGNVVYLN